MQIHPVSFVLGLGAAALVPLFTRVLRPLAVEMAAAGLVVFEEGRRVVARQLETLEDIGAEARARCAEIVARDFHGQFDAEAETVAGGGPGGEPPPVDVSGGDEVPDESVTDARAPRRPPPASRRRVS